VIYTDLKNQGKIPWTINTYPIYKNEGQDGKTSLFWVQILVGGGEHKKRVTEDVYGRCVLYPYMKMEE
jgi:hypothetical protein